MFLGLSSAIDVVLGGEVRRWEREGVAMAEPDAPMVIAQVSSDIWWGPALMAALCIICTAVAMSIRNGPWGRGSAKEEQRPPPGWHSSVVFPPPIAPDDPPATLSPSRVQGDPSEERGLG